MKEVLKSIKDNEENFFDLDKDNKIALMKLEFDNPNDIFDKNAITKTPILNDDFIEWLKCSFEYTPEKYKIDLDISFNDMGGYSEHELKDIFYKNVLLKGKETFNETRRKNKVAIGLILLGIIFFIIMLLINNLWVNGGLFKEILSYIMDIGTTVTFWEALTILIVENKEKSDITLNLIKRYGNINFHQKEEKSENV